MSNNDLTKLQSINNSKSININQKIDQIIKQLGLKVGSSADKYQIATILLNCLSFPFSDLAKKHHEANKLGDADLKIGNGGQTVNQTRIRVEHEYCECCGFIIQKDDIKACSNQFNEINNLGTSTIVFFKTIINIILLLVVMTVIYSVFSFATNISEAKATGYVNSKGNKMDYLMISLGSKSKVSATANDEGQTFYLISSWLGIPMLVIWTLMFIYFKRQTRRAQIKEKESTSVSDYSIVIEKMPYGVSREEVQLQMTEYLSNFSKDYFKSIDKIKIVKYNEGKPFYFKQEEYRDEQFVAIHKKSKELKTQFINWIIERQQESDFSTTSVYRKEKYEQFKINEEMKRVKNSKIADQIKAKLRQKSKESKTTVFVTFETIEQRNFILDHNSNSLLNRIQRIIPCCDQMNRLSIRHDGYEFKNLSIEPAPQPEDINWGNIGVSTCESIVRKILTFAATIGMLGISFVIVYALSTVQVRNYAERYISFLISLVISIINLLIIKVIQYTTTFERIYTMNNYQISLTYKSIMAQLLNSIFIPLIVNYYIKDNNIYKESGLAEDIFILALTNSFLPPIIRIFDPYYFYVNLRSMYYDRADKKLSLNQYQLNRINEKMQFQLGYEYIYLVSIFLFVCFYVSLQPIIPIFAIIGLLCMYWIEKYSLFQRSQRPVPGTDVVSSTMYQMIYFGAAAYALGSLTWSAFLPDGNFRNSLVPNLIAAGLSLLIFLFPYGMFTQKGEGYQPKKSYIERRLYFPSQYDRLNPATYQQGIEQYKTFIAQKKQEINELPSHMQQQVIAQFLHLAQNNIYKGSNPANNIFGNQESVALNNIFLNECRNVVNPHFLLSVIAPDHVVRSFRTEQELRAEAPNVKRRFTEVNKGDSFFKNEAEPSSKNFLDQPMEFSFGGNKQGDEMKNVYRSNVLFNDLQLYSRLTQSKLVKKPHLSTYSHPK